MFRYTLEAKPAVISFALADPGDLVRQAHDGGSLVMLQVTSVILSACTGTLQDYKKQFGGREVAVLFANPD